MKNLELGSHDKEIVKSVIINMINSMISDPINSIEMCMFKTSNYDLSNIFSIKNNKIDMSTIYDTCNLMVKERVA